jgi:outer membrane protein OmpA-like peptidoglycan-associated protein
MRRFPVISAVLLTAATPVFAQVTVDLHALQALPDHPPASHPSRGTAASAVRRPSRAEPAAPTTAAAPNHSSVAAREAPAAAPNQSSLAAREAPGPAVAIPPAAAPPAMPENVPPTADIAPIAPPEPPPGAQPPPPPPVSDKAKTVAAPTTTGLRLTFGPGQSDLSPESSASIKRLTQAAPIGDETTFNVLAYAPGKPDDPSTARRVSLSRAMAVRSALVADGVPSARIFVRALGEQFGDGPPDRVDVSVTGASTPADTAPAATANSR